MSKGDVIGLLLIGYWACGFLLAYAMAKLGWIKPTTQGGGG